MVRRLLIVAAGVLFLVAAAIGWRQWAAWNTITLPHWPPPAEEACDERAVRIHVEWAPPVSREAAVAKADVIVVARRDGGKPEVIQKPLCLWWTAYSFVVEEQIKGNIRPGESVRVTWMGRPVDVVEDFPKPQLGEQYLFLLRAAEQRVYNPITGPIGNMRVIDGRLAAISGRRSLLGVPGQTVADFVAEVRKNAAAK